MKTVFTTIMVTADTKEAIREIAQVNDRSMHKQIRYWVRQEQTKKDNHK